MADAKDAGRPAKAKRKLPWVTLLLALQMALTAGLAGYVTLRRPKPPPTTKIARVPAEHAPPAVPGAGREPNHESKAAAAPAAPAGHGEATGHAAAPQPHREAAEPAHAAAAPAPPHRTGQPTPETLEDGHAGRAGPARGGPGDGLGDSLAWGSTGADIWHALQAGNARFVAGRTQPRDLVARRARLAGGQKPPAMVLACADSRVAPEALFDQGLGDLFVVRTAGNVADPIAVASLEYAVEHLGSRLLVVLGHERCGAVTAVVKGGAMPTRSLAALADRIAPAVAPLRGKVPAEELVHRSAEANVWLQLERLEAESPILREFLHRHELVAVAAMYDLDTGAVAALGEGGAHGGHDAAPAAPPPAAKGPRRAAASPASAPPLVQARAH